jgi:colicin import membrane protein
MPARGGEYEVVIASRLRDDTASGAKEVVSSVERMAADVAATQQRYEDEYSKQISRAADQNQREWEREAQARLRSAQQVEQERAASLDRDAKAQSAAVDRQSREQEQLANKLTIIAAQRVAENERFANQSALIVQKQRDREIADAQRAADAEKKAAEDAARASALSFQNIFGAQFFASLAEDMVRNLFSTIKEGIVDTTLYAARTEELGIALDALSKSNHLNSAAVREQVTALKEANIATQAAEQQVARFVAVGLPLEKASPLAAVAKDLAVISGLNSSDEFEKLVNGIQTLNTRMLRNAGVFIDVKKA